MDARACNSSYSRGRGRRISGTLEIAMIRCTPVWVIEILKKGNYRSLMIIIQGQQWQPCNSIDFKRKELHEEYYEEGQAQWLTPVMQHFGWPRKADNLRSGVGDQPGRKGETWSLLKIQKLARCGGRHP